MSEGLMMGWMFGVALTAIMVFILVDVWKKKK
jgi:hypothetical protein